MKEKRLVARGGRDLVSGLVKEKWVAPIEGGRGRAVADVEGEGEGSWRWRGANACVTCGGFGGDGYHDKCSGGGKKWAGNGRLGDREMEMRRLVKEKGQDEG
ncbi:unnamed protein product [Sphenostylis stenocarpa]|uniref:Uncharacterized protein n=1 Tax=Sphenostylis stenocarpa TaxID=92480 RepID=A0AA86SUD4_9FABA|nr:unnamed protein product [Sphenostylis stenocarpa]